MNSDNLKEQITEILSTACPDCKDKDVNNFYLDMLLQLFQDYAMGCVPEPENVMNKDGSYKGAGYSAWNACRNRMITKIKEVE